MGTKSELKQMQYKFLDIVGEIEVNAVDYYLLKDTSGLVIKFPKNLVFANGLKIADNKIGLTVSLYGAWVHEETEENMKKYSALMFNHFDKLFDIREKITTSERFYYLKPNWLYSGGLYIGTFRYTLGALFKTWENSDDLVYNGNKIIKISGSALSGSNVYSAWDPINKKIVTGSVYGSNTHWKNYVKVFQELSSQRKFSYELNYLQTIELLETIGIKF